VHFEIPSTQPWTELKHVVRFQSENAIFKFFTRVARMELKTLAGALSASKPKHGFATPSVF